MNKSFLCLDKNLNTFIWILRQWYRVIHTACVDLLNLNPTPIPPPQPPLKSVDPHPLKFHLPTSCSNDNFNFWLRLTATMTKTTVMERIWKKCTVKYEYTVLNDRCNIHEYQFETEFQICCKCSIGISVPGPRNWPYKSMSWVIVYVACLKILIVHAL